jgi:hypothetical protein
MHQLNAAHGFCAATAASDNTSGKSVGIMVCHPVKTFSALPSFDTLRYSGQSVNTACGLLGTNGFSLVQI